MEIPGVATQQGFGQARRLDDLQPASGQAADNHRLSERNERVNQVE
jgi:hypothetical protein